MNTIIYYNTIAFFFIKRYLKLYIKYIYFMYQIYIIALLCSWFSGMRHNKQKINKLINRSATINNFHRLAFSRKNITLIFLLLKYT